MKVLWVSNQIFPEFAEEIGQPIPISCGWMYGLAMDLVKKGIELTVVTTRPNIASIHKSINGIDYYLIEGKKSFHSYDSTLEKHWKKIIDAKKPDIAHFHGSEYAHGLALIKSAPNLNYILSIQGLVSICNRYYLGAISRADIRKSITFRDIIRWDNLLQAHKKFKVRGTSVEEKYFKKVKHVIGRTQWDFDHSKILNKENSYHFCNESLRDGFYSTKKWNIKNIKRHSIFLSQAAYPLKGLHMVIKACSFLITEFPDLKIRIAGNNIAQNNTLREKLALSGYGNYVLKLLKTKGMEKHIQFTGPLNENQMISEYLQANAFICPSSIENSPNSVGEAQLLGTPCIASYVGGVPDMIDHGSTGFMYRFEEVEMLAELIRCIFEKDDIAEEISRNSIIVAKKRHDRESNALRTLEIYRNIIQT